MCWLSVYVVFVIDYTKDTMYLGIVGVRVRKDSTIFHPKVTRVPSSGKASRDPRETKKADDCATTRLAILTQPLTES